MTSAGPRNPDSLTLSAPAPPGSTPSKQPAT